MVSIISALIILLIIFVLSIFSSWIDKFGAKHKEAFIDKTVENVINRISSITTSKLAVVMDQYKTGPWYLVVFTVTSPHPIWISNNNIRSVHPDVLNCRLTVKLFNGEDMVIDDVESYDLQAGNEMLDYDFQ